jgi:hypothetical protein
VRPVAVFTDASRAGGVGVADATEGTGGGAAAGPSAVGLHCRGCFLCTVQRLAMTEFERNTAGVLLLLLLRLVFTVRRLAITEDVPAAIHSRKGLLLLRLVLLLCLQYDRFLVRSTLCAHDEREQGDGSHMHTVALRACRRLCGRQKVG